MGVTRRFGRGLVLALQERRRRNRLTSAMAQAVQRPPTTAFGTWGRGAVIAPPVRIDNPQFMHIGEEAVVHDLCWFIAQPAVDGDVPRLVIGARTRVQRFVKIVCAGEVTIGPGCIISDHVYISDTAYRHDDPTRPVAEQGLARPLPVHIGADVLVGFGAIVLPGVTIGDGASIGAGAVVVDNVPARGVVVGNPGRLVRVFDEATQQWRRPD